MQREPHCDRCQCKPCAATSQALNVAAGLQCSHHRIWPDRWGLIWRPSALDTMPACLQLLCQTCSLTLPESYGLLCQTGSPTLPASRSPLHACHTSTTAACAFPLSVCPKAQINPTAAPAGTGKTYTMEGGHEGPTRGIIPRAIEDVFQYIESDRQAAQSKFLVRASYLQIYNEVRLVHHWCTGTWRWPQDCLRHA